MKMNKIKQAILFLFVLLAIAATAFAEDNTTANTTIDNGVVVSNDTTVIPADDNTATSTQNQTVVDDNSTIETTADNSTAVAADDNSTIVDDNSAIADDNSTNVADNTTQTADDNSTQVEDDSAADDNSTVPAVPGTGIVDLCGNDTPTITPDQGFLWGLKRAIENVDSALTLGKSAKAQKGLAHAKERLCEVQLMIQEKKIDAAAKARLRYEQQMNKTEDDINGMENETEVEDIAERLSEHRKFIAKMNSNAIQARGNLTDEQKAALQNLMAAFNGSTNKVKVEIEAKREKLDIKVKAREAQAKKQAESAREKNKQDLEIAREQNKQIAERQQKMDERANEAAGKAIEKSNEAVKKAQEADRKAQEKIQQRVAQENKKQSSDNNSDD